MPPSARWCTAGCACGSASSTSSPSRRRAPHTRSGWEELRSGPGGDACRRCVVADLLLAPGDDAAPVVTLRAAAGRGELQVFQGRTEVTMLAWGAFEAPPGAWRDVTCALGDAYRPDVPVQVRIVAPDGVLVHSVQLGSASKAS